MSSSHTPAKKGPTAYFVFSDEHRSAVHAELQAAKAEGKVGVAEVAKELGRRWKLLTDAEKEEYKTKAAAVAAANAAAQAEEAAAAGGEAGQEEDAQGEGGAASKASAPARQNLPTAVIKRIIGIDEEVGRVSADAVQVISHATELFLELLAERCAHVMANSKPKRSTAKLSDVKEVVKRDRRLVAAGLNDVLNMAQATADARAAEAAANKAAAGDDAAGDAGDGEAAAGDKDKENAGHEPKSTGKGKGQKRKAEPAPASSKPITAFFARAVPANTQA